MIPVRSQHSASQRVRAASILSKPKLWLFPAALSGLLALLLSLIYMGAVLNPTHDLHGLPIAIVNADQGKPPPGQQQNMGTQVTRAITTGPSASSTAQWRQLTMNEAADALASGKVYGALEIPPGFTAAVAALSSAHTTARPTITVLTNPAKGSLGSSLASQITQGAAHTASLTIGEGLLGSPAAHAGPTARLLLTDPVQITTQVGHPIGTHSGLGLSALFYTLLLVLAGFTSANLINTGVDSALGYADREIGPWHVRRPTMAISRTQTLLLKMAMTAGITILTATCVMVATTALLGMDASHLPLLWIYSYCASLTVGLGVQALNATFGGFGQIVAMFAFIVLGLPSSGATIPLQAVPGFYHFLAAFEPMRQLGDGVRAILYFNARADAGLAHAWTMIAIGFALALLFGFTMTRYYDRKGLDRLTPQRP